MLSDYFTFIRSLPLVAQRVYPEIHGLKKVRYNVRFCLWSMLKPNALKQMQRLFEHPDFRPITETNPRMFEKPLKPFVCLQWRPKQRAIKIYEHFQTLHQMYGRAFLDFYSEAGWLLLGVQDCSLILCAGPEREGSLALKLVDENKQDLFTLAFNISSSPKREIHIGALQGPGDHITGRGEIIKSLTRGMHGLRPKALMLEVLLILAREWGVESVYGITNKGHVYQALRYTGSKRSSITYNYSELWAEYGGVEVSKYLYQIPLCPARKDPSSLKKAKRRLYTKRYTWLEEMQKTIRIRLDELLG
ncbi:hypothetical protein CTT30_08410 [Vibrio coralliilyticus]|uniref:VirK/YbjX family protein n=1 Tax=unclassified Vibrio TaxID=2614977 RepID=UPI00207665FD|nr:MULTISPECIES: VirK/YbjX family protein [Vibrio]USD31291.1 DUF535 domain-containing protein [Vibrio sp. SCSIO 43186]USD44336.1 DUF535 domain-containing protein [Vibrio sp. SCSIO 43145]USD68414.1 DUF535 domain-containing protein [Vibrio sp. SCSIO 43139]USD96099.1 hypothetical protein CTT30_08410 [Vibrio coralliilyticus]